MLHREFQYILKCRVRPCVKIKDKPNPEREQEGELKSERGRTLIKAVHKPLCLPSNTQIQTAHMGNQILKMSHVFYLIYNHYSFLLLYMLGCLCFLPYTRVWKTFTFWIRLTSPLFQCLEAISILPFDLELDHTFCDGANTKYLLQPHVLKSLLPTSGIISGGYGSFRWWVYLVDNSLGNV